MNVKTSNERGLFLCFDSQFKGNNWYVFTVNSRVFREEGG